MCYEKIFLTVCILFHSTVMVEDMVHENAPVWFDNPGDTH